MKRLFFYIVPLICSIILSHAAFGAEWKLFYEDEEVKHSYDITSIKYSSDDILTVRTKMYFAFTSKDRYDGSKYVLGLDHLNCIKKKANVSSMTGYDKTGNVINKYDWDNPPWRDIQPDTVRDLLYDILCPKRT